MKETDLFEPVKNLLLTSDMELYTEVSCGYGRADIVAVKDNLATIVELKTSLSLQLIEQVYERRIMAHYTYAAVPLPKNRYFNGFAVSLLMKAGIGLIGIDCNWGEASIHTRAKLNRNAGIRQLNYLHEGQRYENNIPGGSVGGGYWTPYSEMIKQVRRLIERKHPKPVSMAEIIEHVEIVSRHYVQPKSSLFSALTKIEKEWCESVKIDGRTHFRLRP